LVVWGVLMRKLPTLAKREADTAGWTEGFSWTERLRRRARAGHEEGLPEEAFGAAGEWSRYCSLTIVLTLAVTPSAISTTTM
jgi:hypothetical protein